MPRLISRHMISSSTRLGSTISSNLDIEVSTSASHLIYATSMVCYWSKTMSFVILTEGDVELLPDSGYLDSLLEYALTLLFQLSLRQRHIYAGSNWGGQLLDHVLKRTRHT